MTNLHKTIEEVLVFGQGRVLDHACPEEFHNHGIIRKLTVDEIHESSRTYCFNDVRKTFQFIVNGDRVECNPEDLIGPPYSVNLNEIQLSYLEPGSILNRFASINGFSSPSVEMHFNDNNVRPIGCLEVSNQKVEWFFVKNVTDFNSELLKERTGHILVSSYDLKVKDFCHKNNFVFIPFPVVENGFRIKHELFMTRIKGFRADDLARLSQKPIVLDSEQGLLYFFGKKHSRNSQNDYKYVSTIIEHPEEMDGNTLNGYLSDSGDVRSVLNQWRKELKTAVKKTLNDNSENVDACFALLGLGEVSRKGFYSSKLKSSDYIVF